ncbi:MAG: hypothetical protein BMS9Abin17_0643 [Acidimicrobiia bacterium]|nr:MAG: hypothetical protein BMS9Abin17_0643 [Acidimicrobiia bacterium]
MRISRLVIWIAAAGIVVAACGGATTPAATGEDQPAPTTQNSSADVETATMELSGRIETIDAAIEAWRGATSVAEAQAAAETAANLVVGPNGPGFGDRDGDGVVGGSSDLGLLPGSDGAPAGLAAALETNECVVSDVLGGTWTDPGARWDEMLSAIDRWRPDNNTMPSLASHPMRIVGWASFSMESDSLSEIQTFGGHANIHVKVSLRALDC